MIKGEKVYLRVIDIGDINILYKFCSDKDINKYNSYKDILPEKTYIIKNFYILKKVYKRLLSIINEKNVIVGFMNYDPKEDNSSVYKIGITIGKRFWRRGYARDSIRTISKYLFEEKNATRIELEVDKNNIRAINCYDSCGFIVDKRDNIIHMHLDKIEFNSWLEEFNLKKIQL